MPQDPVPAETVSCSLTRDPKLYGTLCLEWSCPGALLCNAANMDSGITSAGTNVINQLVHTY